MTAASGICVSGVEEKGKGVGKAREEGRARSIRRVGEEGAGCRRAPQEAHTSPGSPRRGRRDDALTRQQPAVKFLPQLFVFSWARTRVGNHGTGRVGILVSAGAFPAARFHLLHPQLRSQGRWLVAFWAWWLHGGRPLSHPAAPACPTATHRWGPHGAHRSLAWPPLPVLTSWVPRQQEPAWRLRGFPWILGACASVSSPIIACQKPSLLPCCLLHQRFTRSAGTHRQRGVNGNATLKVISL